MKVGDLVEWVKYEPLSYSQRHNQSSMYGQFSELSIAIIVEVDKNARSSGYYVKLMYEDGKFAYAWSNTLKVIQ